MNKSRMIFVAACFVAALTFFSLYAYVLVPVVFPAKARTSTIPFPDESPENRELLEILFPPDSWVFGKIDMISFSNDAGCILSQDSKFLDDCKVKVSPCVVLWFPNNHKELHPREKFRQAIVLEATHALLEFDGPFVFSGRSPQLIRGELNGVVIIRSDMKKPDSSDDIKLETSDVLFDFNRIQTRNEVDFKFGPNKGRGRDLTIFMANTDESKKGLMPDSIQRIVLQQLDELRLYVENDAWNDSAGGKRAASTSNRHIAAYPQSTLLAAYPQSTLPAADPQAPFRSDLLRLQPESPATVSPGSTQNRTPAENASQAAPARSAAPTVAAPSHLSEVLVQCKGLDKIVELVADADAPGQWLLTFRDQVNVIRTTQGASDQLHCRELIITLGPKQDGLPISNKADDNPLANFGSLTPLRFKAVGDAGSPVTVRSPENKNLLAKGRQMTLDLLRKEFSLTPGDKEPPAAVPGNEVSVSYDQYNIKGRALYYGYASDNGPGKLDMPGAGTLEGMTGTDASKPFKLVWTEGLLVLPYEKDPNLTLIQIRGNPKVELADAGTGTGDEIRILCDMSKKTSGGTGQRSTIAAADGDFDVELKTIVMQRNVRLKTDNGEILTDELEIHFQQPDTTVGTTRSVSRYPGPQLRNPSSAPAANGKLSQMSLFGNGSTSTFTIRADKVDVLASVVGKETIVDQIILTKNVKLDEKTSEPGLEAMHLSGQKVHITQPDTERMIVEVFGDSGVSGGHAMFQGRGVMLLGANINIDRGKNRFWIDGPGQLRISQQVVHAAGSQGGGGSFDKLFSTPGNTGSSNQNQAVIIDWTGNMLFDGRQLWFIKDVNVNYSMMAVNKSDSVTVRLTKPFRFFEKNTTDDIEPEWVEIRGNIDLERDSFAENNGGQLTHDHIRMTAVEFYPITGAFKGLGPGSISSIFLDTGDSANRLLPNGTTAVRSAPTATQATTNTNASGLFGPGLKFLRCNFHHSIEGNSKTGQVTLNDRVVTMLCPAASFRDVIDTNNARNIVAKGMLLECNKLEIVQPPQGGGNKTMDLKAEGNTCIEMTYDNRYYIANADRIKFEQAKNLVTLEGNRYAGVELYGGASLDAPTQRLAAGESVWFNPVTREWRGDGVRMQSLMP